MPELLTLAQMARRLGVSQKWLRGQADSGQVPALKADRTYLFNAPAVVSVVSELAGAQRPTEVAQ